MTTREPTTWIRQPSAVFTANDLDAASGIVVRGDRIVELVETGGEPATPAATVFDASRKVLLPSLINGHHHFYQTLTRAYPPALNKPLFAWLKTLYPVWANLTEESVAVSTRLALAELMLSGCTTASDHHYLFSPALTRAIDVQVEAARELGVRVVLTRGSMSLSVDDGGLPPRSVTEPESTILSDLMQEGSARRCSSDGSGTARTPSPTGPSCSSPPAGARTSSAAPSSASCAPAPPPTSPCSTSTSSGSAGTETRSPRSSCAARRGCRN